MKYITAVMAAVLGFASAVWAQKGVTEADMKVRLDRSGIRCKTVITDTNGMCFVDLADCGNTNIAGLKGLPVTCLNLKGNTVMSFAPLKGMRLTVLSAGNTRVADLTPLKGMRLEYLDIQGTAVANLSPIAGMPIESLFIANTGVTDLTPLTNMPIRELIFTPSKISRGLDMIRKMKTIKRIGVGGREPMPPADFWKKINAKELR